MNCVPPAPHAQARQRAGREGLGAGTRLVPLGAGAALLAARLLIWDTWASTAEWLLWGFGPLVVAFALHLLALANSGRHALEGAAWVATIIAALTLVVFLLPLTGR